MTAKEWKKQNPTLNGNIRDNTDILHLIVLNNLEVINAEMIESGMTSPERLEKLNRTARKHLKILTNNKNITYIEKIDERTWKQ
jgi:hypothetical protein